MATFDNYNTVGTCDNFKGYTGNPPTTEAEYDALDCWVDNTSATTIFYWHSVACAKPLLLHTHYWQSE